MLARQNLPKTADTKFQTAVYLSNLARIGTKLCQNAFQTIPDVLFFDAKKKIGEIFGRKISFLANLAWILTSYSETDVKIIFYVKFCSR